MRIRINNRRLCIFICVVAAFMLPLPILVTVVHRTQVCESCSGPYIKTYLDRKWRNTNHKTIMRWTGFFGDSSWEMADDRYFESCKVKTCRFLDDKNRVREADAVLFHAGATWNFWKGISWPDTRRPEQVWIMHNIEPPTRNPINFGRLGGLFNWTAGYRLDSDIVVPYGGLKKYGKDMQQKYAATSTNFSAERVRLIGWVSSNCYDFTRRLLIINELKEHLPLETYGKCGDNKCPETICNDMMSTYKFFIAIENCICKDYVTEKFWNALRRKQVPVVLGGATYTKFAPPHSFINIADFDDVKSLAAYLRELERDAVKYNQYLEWTKTYDVYGEHEARRIFWCDLCEALHNRTKPAQVYEDFEGWFNAELTPCPQWTLGNQIGRWIDGMKIKLGLM